MRKGFKKGFTLVEMMIVVAIIAILAGVAIPQFMGNIRRAETTEAVGLMKAIIDGQAAYRGSHAGKFYAGTTMVDTLRVLNVALPTSEFAFELQVNSDNNVTIIRAYNTKGGTVATATAPYIYMFAPREGSSLITGTTTGYDADIWDGTVHTIDYINNDGTDAAFVLTGGTWIQ